ncbi:MAG: CAP domain-containing protein [Flavobacteriales bacterium]
MNEEEKQAIYYINLCRTNPKLFSADILAEYLKATGTKKDKVIKGLMDELETTQPLLMLDPSSELTEMARHHAKDMGETGRTGHTGTDGKSFKERAETASKLFNGMNENANYGNEKGLDIVIDLLIDRNVPNTGHRKNILDPEMRYIGVAIEPHKRFGFNCVQDFGGPRR